MIKEITIVVLIILLIGLGYTLYVNISEIYAPAMRFMQNTTIDKDQPSYENNIQFYPNMRFPDKSIGYNIDLTCEENKIARMIDAFNFIQNNTPLTFHQGNDIEVTCQEQNTDIDEKYFVAGEGGPTSSINTSLFFAIQKGKVLLYYKERDRGCDINSYNIELHELLHVFGFEHSSNKNSIMYNVSDCRQVVTLDIISELNRLYDILSLPDLYFAKSSAIKQGRYLNFSVEVKNRGLKKAESVNFKAYDGADNFYSYDLGEIDYGESKILWGLTKMQNANKLLFKIESGDEINKDNNAVEFYLL